MALPAISRAATPAGPLKVIDTWTEGDSGAGDGTFIYTLFANKLTGKYYIAVTTIYHPFVKWVPIQGFKDPPAFDETPEEHPDGDDEPVFPKPEVTKSEPMPVNPSAFDIGNLVGWQPPQYPGPQANLRKAKQQRQVASAGAVAYALDTIGFLNAFDPSTLDQLGRIAVPGGGSFQALSPDGATLYIQSPGQNMIAAVDLASFQVRNTLAMPSGAQPGRIMVSPDSKTVYVVFWPANTQAGTVSTPSGIYVVDAAQNAITATISSPSTKLFFFDAVMTPDGQLIYAMASDGIGGQVFVIDTGTSSIVATLNVPVNSTVPATNVSTVMHPAGRFVYTILYHDVVAVIDTSSNTLVSKVTVSVPDGSFLDLLRLQINTNGTLLIAQAYKLVTDSENDEIEHSFLFAIETVYNVVVGIVDVGTLVGEGNLCFTVV
jgi:hypothetical protein